MKGEERRKEILRRIGRVPVSASALASQCGVSRQVIVHDIALLRAEGAEIVSTNRGYVLGDRGTRHTRIFKVRHTDAETREELYLIADAGGCTEDVFVWHKAYGKMRAELMIRSRREADAFMEKLETGVSVPLKNITAGYHYHCVSAESEEVLDEIGRRLSERGFLVPEKGTEEVLRGRGQDTGGTDAEK